MSSFLSLIEFTPNEDGQITEKNSKTLKRVNITEDLLNELKEDFCLIPTLILEDDDSDLETEFNFLDEDMQRIRNSLKKKIESILISLDKDKIESHYDEITSSLFILLSIKDLIEIKTQYNNPLIRIKVSM